MKITELKGRPHVFTLTNGKTLRIYPYSQCEVKDSLIPKSMERAVTSGLITMTKVADKKPKEQEPETLKKVSDKKLGGAK